jgi:Mce-associated membrane protein
VAPHRRRPAPTAGQAPQIRRPKVAGLRNRPEQPPAEHSDVELDQESVKNLLNGVRGTPPAARRGAVAEDLAAETAVLPRITDDEPSVEDKPAITGVLDTEPADTEPVDTATVEPEIDPETNEPPARADVDTEDAPVRTGRKRRPATRPDTDTEDAPVKRRPTAAAAPTAKPRSDTIRPAGKRRVRGAARPTDLEAAETDTGVESKRPARHARVDDRPTRTRAQTQISMAIILTVVAVVLAGAAVFFRGEANDLTSGDSNTALTDSATTSQLKGQLTTAIKQTFSYNYTDLDSTQKAVKENLTGKALCEYNLLFGEVKQYAPQQKIVLDTTVRELAVTRIDGDRAEALVYIDQLSTRVDVNKTVAVGGQFGVRAQRAGDHWKITEFDMFGQPLFNGKPAPTC